MEISFPSPVSIQQSNIHRDTGSDGEVVDVSGVAIYLIRVEKE